MIIKITHKWTLKDTHIYTLYIRHTYFVVSILYS